MSLHKAINNWCIRRYICSSIVKHAKGSLQQGKFMKKLIATSIPKKKWYPAIDANLYECSISNVTPTTNKRVKRRQTVLNKLFMKYITDLMTTGEISTQIVGRGIEISRVDITSDFHLVRVFWFLSHGNAEQITKTAQLLDQCAYKLRHELSQLKIIGVVPPIQFVRDKSLGKSIELENIMLEADYGDDFTPSVKILRQPQLTLFTKLSDDVREKIVTIESIDELDDKVDSEIYHINLPQMRHDVLGLDHWSIMTKVKQALKKREQTSQNRRLASSGSITQQAFDVSQMEIYRSEEETEAFNAFLLSRRIQEKQRKRYERDEYMRKFQIYAQSADNNQTDYQDDYYEDDDDNLDIENEDDVCDEDFDGEKF